MDMLFLKECVFFWELGGVFFVIAAGSLLHFVYAWSGCSTAVGLFAPVNESVWEHLKLGFWPMVVFSSAEYWFVREAAANFLFAKFLGVTALMLTIVLIHYTYLPFTRRPVLPADIGSFVLGTIVCQALSLLVYSSARPSPAADIAGGAGLAVLALCFALFTFFPPKLAVFKDRPSGRYGPVRKASRKNPVRRAGSPARAKIFDKRGRAPTLNL